MLKISDFSKLGHVTVRALRFYERIGLLKPSHVDDWTGYRYYSAAQLPRLNRILTLKDLGLSLVEIAQLLDEEVPAPRLRRVLELKQLELQQRVEDEQARLRRVAERLRQIEQEGTMSHYDVVLKEVEAQTVASAREVVSSVREMPERCGAMSRAVYKLAEGRGLKVVGACMAIYHDQGSYREEDIDTEMAVPVEGASADESGHVTDGTATIRALPRVESMASVVHHGGYDTIMEAYGAVAAWIERGEYTITGPCREMYLQGPEAGAPVTELQFPVQKA